MIITDKLEAFAPVADEAWSFPGLYEGVCGKLAAAVVGLGNDVGAFLSKESVRFCKVRNAAPLAVESGRAFGVRGYWSPPTSKGVEFVGGAHDGCVQEVAVPDGDDGYPTAELVLPGLTQTPVWDPSTAPMPQLSELYAYRRLGINSATDRWVYKFFGG